MSRQVSDVSTMRFGNLCEGFTRLSTAPANKKKAILAQLWQTFGHSSKTTESRQNLFPLMRLLMPEIDESRGNYRLKQQSLADIYIDIIGVSRESERGKVLKNYTKPSKSVSGIGDFFTVLLDILKSYARPQSKPSTLTIADINEALDAIVNASSKPAQLLIFQRFLTALTPSEHMWLGRIIVKDMKFGMKPDTMLKEFYPNALESYRMCSSLLAVCAGVTNPMEFNKHFSSIQVGNPCKPMLAYAPPDWKLIVNWLANVQFIIEDKYDGERLMIHKNGSDIKLFSRNSFDLTDRWSYGTALSKAINAALPSVSVAILDGELMSWNKETRAFMPFGANRPTSRAGDDHVDLCFVCFDLLFLDGESWLTKPLYERKKKLSAIVRPQPGLFELIECHYFEKAQQQQISDCLDLALSRGREGIILKQIDTEYKLGDRGKEWIKLKPDMIKGLHDTLDVLVLGAYYGEGTRRAGGVSTFLVGVAEPHPPGQNPTKFYAFGKVGTGYSTEQLADLRDKLKDKFVPFDERRPPPHWVKWKPERSDKPDMWLKPEDSVILEVKCYEVTDCRTSKFISGFTWRFPRVERIRWDKLWSDCMTLEEAEEMARTDRVRRRTMSEAVADGAIAEDSTMSATFGNSLMNTLDPLEWSSLEPKPETAKQEKKAASKRGLKRNRAGDGVSVLFKPTDVSKVVMKTKLFDGMSFCILSIDPAPAPTKRKLEKLIAENGGKCTAHPSSTTKYLLASRNDSLIVTLEKKSGKHDIVHWSWLTDSVQQQQIIQSLNSYHIFLTPATMVALEHEVDQFGDSFVTDITANELKKILEMMEGQEVNPGILPELEDLSTTLRRSNSELDLFNGLVACHAQSDGNESKQQIDALRLGGLAFRAHGGQLLERPIEVDDAQLDSEMLFLVDNVTRYVGTPRVFDWRWVERCIKAKTVQPLDEL